MKIFLLHILIVLSFLFPVKGQLPYEIKKPTDLTIIGSCITLGISSRYFHLKDSCLSENDIGALNSQSINGFDRCATKNWSPLLAHVSDAGLLLCISSPALLLASSEIRKDAPVFALMSAENLLSALFLTALTKTTTRRIRPFVYNPMVPPEKKLKPDARRSFFSGHTSLAFCSAVFTSSVFGKSHPDSPLRPWVWGSSLAVASGVGYLRFASGKHFPSDIIAGAMVGSAIGYAIPRLHEIKTKKHPGTRYFSFTFFIPL
jgi:membrane-associated phospholipid phosphatase